MDELMLISKLPGQASQNGKSVLSDVRKTRIHWKNPGFNFRAPLSTRQSHIQTEFKQNYDFGVESPSRGFPSATVLREQPHK